MKIRTAIFVVYVAVSAAGFAVLMGLTLRDVRLRYVESMRRTLGDTAVLLAALAAEGPRADGAWAQKLATLPSNPELLRVFASDTDDRVLFDSARGRDVGQVYFWPMRGGGPIASEHYTKQNVAEVNGELRVRTPVRMDGDLVGWVGVGRPLASITAGVTEARWRLATYSCLIAGVMIVAGWWIASRLTHSLERLTAYAQAVRDGRSARPPASKAAEIAALGQAFEEMRVTLEGKAHVERYTQALAHEFKAPLSAIRGAAELLAEDLPAEDRARFVANLRAESDRLQRIVERLLELSALEARRAGEALTADVDLRAVVAQACDGARVAAERKGVTVALAPGGAPRVRGEHFLLGQAVGNLVQNALAFTPAGGAVTIELSVRGGTACVAVTDTGPGVPDYALEKIFDRFYSLPRPDTGRKSSGLGLSIVREIARLHGGEVTLGNRPEGGARAELTLPVTEAAQG
ncbi:MAG: two-component system sensor histidine kinase CreC [Verrucomicrobia bacterium]|nr:two-component system sensor histidine kinase CreC [Verrucomicrobiota bacterium]